jgi:acyl dehydratase
MSTETENLLANAVVFASPADVACHIGKEVCVGAWSVVSQTRIDDFARATGDHQWIHVDRERATHESPYGGTIAHGFLTLSLLGQFYEAFLTRALPFCDMGLNYGLNRVRFPHPVRAGSRVRCRMRLDGVEPIDRGLQLTFGVTIELENETRPACVAESVVRRLWRASESRA